MNTTKRLPPADVVEITYIVSKGWSSTTTLAEIESDVLRFASDKNLPAELVLDSADEVIERFSLAEDNYVRELYKDMDDDKNRRAVMEIISDSVYRGCRFREMVVRFGIQFVELNKLLEDYEEIQRNDRRAGRETYRRLEGTEANLQDRLDALKAEARKYIKEVDDQAMEGFVEHAHRKYGEDTEVTELAEEAYRWALEQPEEEPAARQRPDRSRGESECILPKRGLAGDLIRHALHEPDRRGRSFEAD